MKLFRNKALIYTIGSLMNSSVSFLLLPFFVKNLSTEDYGSWVLIETVIILFSIIFMVGLDVAMVKISYNSPVEQRPVIVKSVFLTLLSSIVFMLLILQPYILFSPKEFVFLKLSSGFLELIIFIIISELISLFLLAYFRLQDEAVSFSLFSVIKVLSTLSSMVMIVLLFVSGLEGAIIGRTIGNLIVLLSALWKLIPIIFNKHTLSKSVIKEALVYGYPLILNNISMQIVLLSDRFFIKSFHGAYEVGLYSLAYKIAAIFDVVFIRPFGTIWGTYRFKLATYKNAKELYSSIILLFIFMGSFLTVLLTINSRELILIISTKEYLVAATAFNIIVVSYFVYALTYPVNIGLMLESKTKVYATLTLVSGICNLAMNLILISLYGINGAAFATLSSYLIWLILIYLYSQKYYLIKVKFKKVILTIFFSTINFSGLSYIEMPNPYLSILFKTIICTISFFLFYLIVIRQEYSYFKLQAKGAEQHETKDSRDIRVVSK
ncbi:hypothetical protein COJ36_02850 [Priestia megaterium]|uniref:oligosaccharide flippase family protein n=1 Tax=Priestia megaterium TaxID=1404 RepID=UPI000BF60641|nr:oligosaccharide flippase family protein [Priestia megaterium]PFL70508.1 hypothetical protein COJ36_02850 [Priestia megaterium]